jgi:hypothetical protein
LSPDLFRRNPPSIWVIYATTIRGPYSGKVVGVAFAAEALTHVFLFVGYGLYKAGVLGNARLLVYAVVIGFTPIILAAMGCRFFKPELLRPVPVLPTPTPNQAMERTADRSAFTFCRFMSCWRNHFPAHSPLWVIR